MEGSQLRGDEAILFEAHHARLASLLRRTVRASPAVIEDACATAWEIFLRRQPARDDIGGWLYVVARREAWRLCSRELRTQPLEDRSEPAGEADMELRIALTDGLTAIRRLPRRRREALLKHVAGFSYAEIGAGLGLSWRGVDKQLRKARRELKRGAC